MSKQKSPKNVTVYGRLSFPSWTPAEAYALSLKGSYPDASEAESVPHFNLVLDQAQFDKVKKHAEEVFLPYCAEQTKAGEKKDALKPGEVKQLIDTINGDLDAQTLNTPFKVVSEKTADLVPDGVAVVKAMGSRGTAIQQFAIVNDEDELAVPDPDILSFPLVKPINETNHTMYPGCYVSATLNLYAYRNGKHPGFSAGANAAVFKMDGESFSGGTAIDFDEIFVD